MQKHASLQTVFRSMPQQDVVIDREFSPLPSHEISFLHYHEHYEIGICREGEGLFVTPTDAQAVSEGDLIFFPPGIRHYSRSLTPCFCRFVYVRATAVPEALTVCVPHVIRNTDGSSAAILLRQLMQDVDKANASRRILLRMSLFLLEANDRFPAEGSIPAAGPAQQIAEYLASHYRLSVSSQELSLRFHLSQSQLRRRFSAVYGCSPIEYRNRLRCRIAKELLEHTDYTVAEIADRVGFSSPSELYRLFLRYYESSPRQLRQAVTP